MLLTFVVLLISISESYALRRYAAIVVDGRNNNILFGHEETAKRYPASLTKKMTLYILFEALKHGFISKNTRFQVSRNAARQEPSKLGCKAGTYVTVDTIIRALTVKSANDMAVVAAEGLRGSVPAFAAYMNKKARQLGMKNTKFVNPNGLPNKQQITTAFDMAILGIALYRDFSMYTHYFKLKSFRHDGKLYKTTNKMVGKYYGLDGIKTGYTNSSGFNISTSALRYDAHGKPRRIYAVVLGENTRRMRDKKASEILNAGFRHIGISPYSPSKKGRLESLIQKSPKLKKKARLASPKKLKKQPRKLSTKKKVTAKKANPPQKNTKIKNIKSAANKKALTKKEHTTKATAKKATTKKATTKKAKNKTVARTRIKKQAAPKKRLAQKVEHKKVLQKKPLLQKATTKKITRKKNKKVIASKKAASKKAALKKAALKKAVSKKTASKKAASKKAASKKAASKKAASKKAAPKTKKIQLRKTPKRNR